MLQIYQFLVKKTLLILISLIALHLSWAKENDFKVEKLDFASFFETGFSYWQVRSGSSGAKVILVDENNKKIGVYLMTGFGHPVIARFVSAEEIKFKNPIIDQTSETKLE